MTLKELDARITRLEQAFESLRTQTVKPEPKEPWWISGAGRFANDPIFDEIVRLGREYRESLRPDGRKKKRKVVKKKHARS
jgi:hypothetical protein